MKQRLAKPSVREMPAQAESQHPDSDLQQWIAEAAYFRAESRGFQPGGETDDWLAAEAEILARLRGGRTAL